MFSIQCVYIEFNVNADKKFRKFATRRQQYFKLFHNFRNSYIKSDVNSIYAKFESNINSKTSSANFDFDYDSTSINQKKFNFFANRSAFSFTSKINKTRFAFFQFTSNAYFTYIEFSRNRVRHHAFIFSKNWQENTAFQKRRHNVRSIYNKIKNFQNRHNEKDQNRKFDANNDYVENLNEWINYEVNAYEMCKQIICSILIQCIFIHISMSMNNDIEKHIIL